MPLNLTKLAYMVIGGLANLALWCLVVGSFESLRAHADAVGATLATLFGAAFGAAFYTRKHPSIRKDR
jgi:hypothetical protein